MSIPADLILTSGTVHTMQEADDGATRVTAIAVKDGVIVAVGGAADARSWGDETTERIDFPEATITPGLIDAHSHAISGATNTARGVDLFGLLTVDSIVERLRDYAATVPEDEWVLGWGLDPNAFVGATPTGELVTRAIGDRPGYVRMFDGHSALATPAALAVAGIDGPREFPTRAEIVCDGDGVPTGLLLEAEAEFAVLGSAPSFTVDAAAHAAHQVLAGMAASGLTSSYMLDFDPASIDVLRRMEELDPLPVRLRASPVFSSGLDFDVELERVIALQGTGGDRWIIDGVKLVLDGTVDNGTAWLHEPDSHGESTESLWLDIEEYRRAVHALAARGIATATHAIGDAAILEAVRVIAEIPAEQRAQARHRIEHIETMPVGTMELMIEAKIVASMQPTHSTLYVWGDHTDNWSERLGHERAAVNGWRMRELYDAGVTVALGSDWPIAPYDPREIMADAQLRRPHDRPELLQVLPHQALTARMALEGYTTSAAYAVGWENSTGRIAPGLDADFTVFAADPLAIPAEDLAETPILATFIGGIRT